MKSVLKILTYALAVVLIGALLAPPLYWGGRWFGQVVDLPVLREAPFARYFNRAVMATALLLLWPFFRWIGVRSWRDLHLKRNPRRLRDLARGALIAAGAFFVVAVALWLVGDIELRRPFRAVHLRDALLTGAIVAVIEELFFRGALLGVLRRHLRWPLALAFLSAFFAIVHFVQPHPAMRAFRDVHWYSGYALLPYAFHQFSDPLLLLVGWLTLALLGWILGYAVVRTESLYMAIGLHGGFVFALKAFSTLTRRTSEPNLWVGKNLTTGIVPLALLVATAGIVWLTLRRRQLAGR